MTHHPEAGAMKLRHQILGADAAQKQVGGSREATSPGHCYPQGLGQFLIGDGH